MGRERKERESREMGEGGMEGIRQSCRCCRGTGACPRSRRGLPLDVTALSAYICHGATVTRQVGTIKGTSESESEVRVTIPEVVEVG